MLTPDLWRACMGELLGHVETTEGLLSMVRTIALEDIAPEGDLDLVAEGYKHLRQMGDDLGEQGYTWSYRVRIDDHHATEITFAVKRVEWQE